MPAIIAQKEVTQHILRTFNIRANKSLGQNFLISPEVVRLIVEAAEITPDEPVLEIGPGIGTLTQGLALAGAKVTAIELDKRLLPILDKTLEGAGQVQVIHGDILQTDIKALMQGQSFKVAANLPYYITTPIVLKLLEEDLPIERLVTMVQKEVAERMVASPGGKDYGALSIAVQYHAEVSLAFVVPANCFMPAPNVQSAVVVCKKRTQPIVEVVSEKLFFRVVKAAFSQRRKMLSNCLKNMGVDSQFVENWLQTAAIDGKRRAETLSLQEFALLTNSFATLQEALKK